MNFFRNYTYTWWQIGIFKLALLLIGASISSYFHEFFAKYFVFTLGAGIICAIYIGYVSFKERPHHAAS